MGYDRIHTREEVKGLRWQLCTRLGQPEGHKRNVFNKTKLMEYPKCLTI